MKRVAILTFALVVAALGVFVVSGGPATQTTAGQGNIMPASDLFDPLGQEADVIYLLANSSLVFGPDPHGRSEEITFVGPVTVPKWPMKGYGRRILPDGRQQIDIELTQSDLTGESYVMGGPVVLGEHPDLRSLGTITERLPRDSVRHAANTDSGAQGDHSSHGSQADAENSEAEAEEVPADFVVKRKVLITTAKGILYNETAVPVRGRVDAIPPVKFQNTPTGVNVFRGMELPVALLDKTGNVNGWFYSKTHMAYAVKPAAIERSFLSGTVALRQGDRSEDVAVSGPVEIHHLATGAAGNDIEFMVLALRGHSELLGGDVMLAESFSDRDHFSKGKLAWTGQGNGQSTTDLYLDLYTPATKLTTREPIPLQGKVSSFQTAGSVDKGKLHLPMYESQGKYTSGARRTLYDEAEKPAVEIVSLQFDLSARK